MIRAFNRITFALVAAFVLSFALTLGAGAIPLVARACTSNWTVEASNYKVAAFYDVNRGGTNFVNGTMSTWNDGCGYKQYEMVVWLSYPSAGAYYAPQVRVWVCGNYYGQFSSQSSTVWSGQYYYGGCGRQSDNYHSGIYMHNNGTSYYIPYAN